MRGMGGEAGQDQCGDAAIQQLGPQHESGAERGIDGERHRQRGERKRSRHQGPSRLPLQRAA